MLLSMLLAILSILVFVGVICLAIWGVRSLVVAFGVGDPWATVIYVVAFVLLAIVAITFLPSATHMLPVLPSVGTAR